MELTKKHMKAFGFIEQHKGVYTHPLLKNSVNINAIYVLENIPRLFYNEGQGKFLKTGQYMTWHIGQ